MMSTDQVTLAGVKAALKKFWEDNPQPPSPEFDAKHQAYLKRQSGTPTRTDKSRSGQFQPDLATLPPQEHQKAQETHFSRDLGMEKQP